MQDTLSKTLSKEKLAELLKLARLTILSEQEEALDQSYLETMIASAAKIDRIDANGLLPATHAFDVTQRLRDDVVTDSGEYRRSYHQLAPIMIDGFYCVPAVLTD